eukprot:3625296-Rhodomonas_salina.2
MHVCAHGARGSHALDLDDVVGVGVLEELRVLVEHTVELLPPRLCTPPHTHAHTAHTVSTRCTRCPAPPPSLRAHSVLPTIQQYRLPVLGAAVAIASHRETHGKVGKYQNTKQKKRKERQRNEKNNSMTGK